MTILGVCSVDDLPFCDFCDKRSDDQEYVGYGDMACQGCIETNLVRIPGGFRFKTLEEQIVESSK